MEENKVVNQTKKSSNVVMIVILIVAIIAIIAALVLLLGNSKNEEPTVKPDENKPEEVEKIEEVQLSEDEANKLISYVPEANPYSNEREYSAFDSKKVNASEMDANWLVYRAMQDVTNKGTCTKEQFNLNGICDFTLTLDDVKAAVKKLYGDINVFYPNIVENNFVWKCTLDGNVYACSNTGGGEIASEAYIYFNLGGTTRTFTRFQKAEKDSKNLYVYAKYAKLEMVFDDQPDELQAGDLTFRIRKYGTGNEVIDETILNGSDYYEENASVSFYDKLYNQFKDKITTYKLTYSIDGSEYHLTSVEPVE